MLLLWSTAGWIHAWIGEGMNEYEYKLISWVNKLTKVIPTTEGRCTRPRVIMTVSVGQETALQSPVTYDEHGKHSG